MRGSEPLDDLMRGDFRDGIEGSGVKPGILKCAIDAAGLTEHVDRVVRSIIRIHRETNAPICIHTAAGEERGLDALRIAYDWLEANLPDSEWAAGDTFTMADCAAAPALFYADWVEEIGAGRPRLQAYRARLLAHPAVSDSVEGARPYRAYFPLGAPDRD